MHGRQSTLAGAPSLRTLPGFAEFRYDAVGPPAERAAAKERALEVWRGSPRSGSGPGARVLLDADGEIEADRWQRLLAERDDRPVELRE